MTKIIKRFPTVDLFNGESLLDSFFPSLKSEFNFPDWTLRNTVPAVNITEKDKSYGIEMAAPGYNKKDFRVELENGTLTVSADKEEKKEEKDKVSTRREYAYSSFSRSFTLPENCKSNDIESKYENGILIIDIPKREIAVSKPKKQIAVA